MDSESKIFVAGHNGLVGSAIVRNLEAKGFTNIITMDRAKLDLTKLHDVQMFFAIEQPEYVFLAAAKVGGIGANSEYPADFIYENLMIQTNVISSAAKCGVEKLLFLGSSCIYPKFANQPITEDQLLGGHLEPSNSAYAVARLQVLICANHIANSMDLMLSQLCRQIFMARMITLTIIHHMFFLH